MAGGGCTSPCDATGPGRADRPVLGMRCKSAADGSRAHGRECALRRPESKRSTRPPVAVPSSRGTFGGLGAYRSRQGSAPRAALPPGGAELAVRPELVDLGGEVEAWLRGVVADPV